MKTMDMKTNAQKHPIMYAYDGMISMAGYENLEPQSTACFFAGTGNHFLEYGISENSLLMVSFGAKPKPGDLVITGTKDNPAVRIFSDGGVIIAPDGLILTTDPNDTVLAVILGAINFFR